MAGEHGEPPSLGAIYAMPLFLARILPAGVIGLITSAMIAAFMSTHDSYLLCWSSVLTQDVVAPLCGNRLNTKQRVLLTRLLIVAIGIYIWAWGLFYHGSDDIWDYMAITGAIYFTGAFAVLMGGLYWKRASRAGAWAALLCGFTAILGLGPIRRSVARGLLDSMGQVASDARADALLSSPRVGLLTIGCTVASFFLFSVLFPDRRSAKGDD
jgi:SSS family solute:Na+ symporter